MTARPRASATPPFYVSIACWIDLLGYGRMMSDAGFDPVSSESKIAVARLRRFHRLVAQHSSSRFPTVVMNDGAVAYRDLDYLSAERTMPFLLTAWRLFKAVNEERGRGQAGARMVIATGFRMKGRRAGGESEAARRRAIVSSVADGSLTLERAIERAARGSSYFDVVPQLQANFAFTAAYLAEQSGKEGGLPGANCYVDLQLFSGTVPYLQIGRPIHWDHKDLELARFFAPVLDLNIWGRADDHSGARTGLEIAYALAEQEDLAPVLETYLRAARTLKSKKR